MFLSRDEPASAATLDGQTPTTNCGLGCIGSDGYGPNAAEGDYDRIGWFAVRHNCGVYDNRIIVKPPYTNSVIAASNLALYDLRMVKKSSISKAFVEWLDAGLKKSGKTNVELARRLDIPQARVSEMRNFKRDPQFYEVPTIADYIEEPLPGELLPPGAAVVRAPILSIVSAGKLRNDDWQQDIIGQISVNGLSDKGEWVAFVVEGDSMDRISPPDSIILVNRKDKKLAPNACYVIADKDGKSSYKRFRPSPDRFEPVSTSAIHETIFPAADSEITVVGRVRRTILEM